MIAKTSIFTTGLILISFAVALIIKSDLGAAPWDALAAGQANSLQLTIGTCAFINGFVVMFINAILLKEKPEVLGAVTILLLGLLIDFWMLIVLEGFEVKHLALRLVTFVFGILILGMGVATYLQVKFPANPIDKLMIAIKERFRLSLLKSKIICDLCALLLAFLFKGAIGIGTIIVTLTLGMAIQYFYPIVQKYTKHVLDPKQNPPNHGFGN